MHHFPPPYWGLRDYGTPGQLGLENTPEEYVANLVEVFREVRRVLRNDGTLWLNLGDSYARDTAKGGSGPGGKHERIPDYGNARKILGESRGSSDGAVGRADRAAVRMGGSGLKPKDLVGIPWMVAFALRADGWYLRSDIIWAKPNPMPESVRDRPTKSHEHLFLLTKAETYLYDAGAIKEPVATSTVARLSQPRLTQQVGSDRVPGKTNGRMKAVGDKNTRNARSVWAISTRPFKGAHFATFPQKLIEPCILAGTSPRACEVCGAPWRRVVERTAMVIRRSERAHEKGRTRSSGTMVEPATTTTTGWEAACPCENTGSGRCVVLDPFGGAGTTALVATQHGRDSVLIEINPSYIDLTRKRLEIPAEPDGKIPGG